MNAAEQYHRKVTEILELILTTQMPALKEAARLVADTVERDGIVYTLGSGHSLLIAIELYYRAGGMANFDVLHDKTFGRAERLSGYAKTLLESCPIGPNDLLIVASNSGRNPLPVEMAQEAKARGISVIGITSLAHARSVASRAQSGTCLFEVCDVVIDNCGIPGDASVDLETKPPVRVGPTSTLAGVFVSNCIVGLAASELSDRGIAPPVFVSANLDQGDSHNRRLLDFMRNRIRGL